MAILITDPIGATFSVPGIGGTAAANATSSPAATALTTNGTTSVQLSQLGQLLAAASAFQSQLATLRPGAASSGAARNLSTDFASLAVQAQSFVDAFNRAQASIAGLDTTRATQFAQALKDRAVAAFANGDSGVNLLAQLGIEVQPDGTLTLDLRSLQTQFNANPPATFTLLAEAVRAFGTLAAGAQTGNLPTTSGTSTSVLNELSRIIAFQALFTGTSTSTTPLGLGTLLALGPVTQGGTVNNVGQQLTALSHFALVSSLLA